MLDQDGKETKAKDMSNRHLAWINRGSDKMAVGKRAAWRPGAQYRPVPRSGHSPSTTSSGSAHHMEDWSTGSMTRPRRSGRTGTPGQLCVWPLTRAQTVRQALLL